MMEAGDVSPVLSDNAAVLITPNFMSFITNTAKTLK